MTEIIKNDRVLRGIVHAIEKAIADDIPQIKSEYSLDTMNYLKNMRSDFINENLKREFDSDDMEFIRFLRFSWKGRILVDSNNKITYTITTQQNLNRIANKKDRSRPHFLQSILFVENGDLEGRYRQVSLFDEEPFTEEIFLGDYENIIQGLIDPGAGYRHYIVTYSFENDELLDVRLKFLDKEFLIIDEISLNEYIRPDFAKLTAEMYSDENQTAIPVNQKATIKLKSGIKPKLKEIEKRA